MKVLIAEDAPMIRRRLSSLVGGLSRVSRVLEAGDAASAIRLAAAERPRVVLLDLRLPGARGLSLLRALARLAPRPAIIVLTSFGSPALHRLCLQEGASRYFEKDNGFLNAVSAVRELLEGNHAGGGS